MIYKEEFNVLSLFDGMSCGQIALNRVGIKVNNYFASEIDKHGIKVTQDNFPNTIQIGDVTKVSASSLPKINLLIGGSPCQGFSFAGNGLNFEDSRSKLFFEYVRILKEIQNINSDVKFLLENVKMKKEYRKVISEHLGVNECFIDSSNFSAHNRPRYYWTNIVNLSDLKRIDSGIVLKDILEKNAPNHLYLSDKEISRGIDKNKAQIFKSGNKCGAVSFPTPIERKAKSMTVVNIKGSREGNHIQDSKGIRVLTRLERERLQTVPEGYTNCVTENQAFSMLGNGWTVDVITHILKNIIQNKIKMTKLKKRGKSFTASNETETVFIEGVNYEIANLLNSGITHQKIVLLAVNDIWHEIDATNLGADNSDLKQFKTFVENFSLKLSDLGVTEEKPVIDYEMKHEDFMELSLEFPEYDYIKISVLNSYLKTSSLAYGVYALRQILKMLTEKGMTIKDYIANVDAQKTEIINNEKPKIIEMVKTGINAKNRVIELASYGILANPAGYYEGKGFTVTITSVEEDSNEDWTDLISRISAAAAAGNLPLEVGEDNQTAIPIPVIVTEIPVIDTEPISAVPITDEPTQTPAKKPISLEVISSLSPDRISELQGLKEVQNKIVAANPFIKITDAESLKKAKESESALLKASTAIDGTKGILTTFVTHANQFIKMGKDFLNPLAQITREAYDKQKAERINYENAEAIKAQNEAKAALEKINTRTSRLFEIPMVFNGEIYSIGTLFVLPSQIEKSTDEEFELIVSNGLAIKSALDGAESEKDKQIRDLQEKLEKLMLVDGMSNTTEAPAPPVEEISVSEAIAIIPSGVPFSTDSVTPMPTPVQNITPAHVSETSEPSKPIIDRFRPSETYTLPNDGNSILSKFDLEHVEFISANPMLVGFIKSRGYFIEGTKQTALKIKSILANPDQTVKKSVAISELCEALLMANN